MKAGVASLSQENEVQILSSRPVRAGGWEGSLRLGRALLCDITYEHSGTSTDLCSSVR